LTTGEEGEGGRRGRRTICVFIKDGARAAKKREREKENKPKRLLDKKRWKRTFRPIKRNANIGGRKEEGASEPSLTTIRKSGAWRH
jgi:hypothetical protein